MCDRHTTMGSTAWHVNDVEEVVPGVTFEITNAINNTRYVCVSLIDGMAPIDSEPVYLYIAGVLILKL